jgi:hypothetical protein
MFKSSRLLEEHEGNIETENSNYQTNLPTPNNKLFPTNLIPNNIKPYIYSIQKELILHGYQLNQSYSFLQVKSLLIDLSRKVILFQMARRNSLIPFYYLTYTITIK